MRHIKRNEGGQLIWIPKKMKPRIRRFEFINLFDRHEQHLNLPHNKCLGNTKKSLGGWVAIVHHIDDRYNNIIKDFAIKLSGTPIIVPLGIWRSYEVFMERNRTELILVDPTNPKKKRSLPNYGRGTTITQVFTFKTKSSSNH